MTSTDSATTRTSKRRLSSPASPSRYRNILFPDPEAEIGSSKEKTIVFSGTPGKLPVRFDDEILVSGVATITVPSFVTILPFEREGVTVAGRTVTYEFGPGALDAFVFNFPVRVPAGPEGAIPQKWDMPISAIWTKRNGGVISTSKTESGVSGWVTKPVVTVVGLAGEVEPGSRLRYLVRATCSASSATSGSLGIDLPFLGELDESSFIGLDGGVRDFGQSGLVISWADRAPPSPLQFSFEIEVWSAELLRALADFGITTQVTASYTACVETDADADGLSDRFCLGDVGDPSPELTINLPDEEVDLIVNSTGDRPREAGSDGCDTGFTNSEGKPECTLRSAIQALNAGIGGPITFDIPGDDVPVIFVSSLLPTISRPVVIDGSTSSAGQVLVRGNMLGGVAFDVQGGGSELKNLVIQGFTGADGGCIKLSASGDNKVTGCKFGTDITGNIAESGAKSGVTIDGCGGNEIRGCIVNAEYFGVALVGDGANNNTIEDNRFGIAANGSRLTMGDAVILVMGTGNRIANNLIATGGSSILAIATESDSGLTITGNRIGLLGDGATGIEGGLGIMVATFSPATDLTITNNTVAGTQFGIAVSHGVTGVTVSDNQLGLTAGSPGISPPGVSAGHQEYGVFVAGAANASIRRNTIAGYRWGMLVAGTNAVKMTPFRDDDGDGEIDSGGQIVWSNPESGSTSEGTPVGGAIVEANTVGLNKDRARPAGVDQTHGVTVFADATGVQVLNNTVAGHYGHQIWLSGGGGHVVSGNTLGTIDGSNFGIASISGVRIDGADQVTVGPGNVISGLAFGTGIKVEGAAEGCLLKDNYIGTNRGATRAWPNRTGISTASSASGGSPSGLRITGNVIAGSGGTGVEVGSASGAVTLEDNSIGVSIGGLPLPNRFGVTVSAGASVVMSGNTVAHNTVAGIDIAATGVASVRKGTIYANGDGMGAAGIRYASAPFAAPSTKVIRTTDPVSGQIKIILAVSPVAGGGVVEFDLFANPAEDQTQGRSYLFKKSALAGEKFLLVQNVRPDSALATSPSLTLTATKGGSTSAFSTRAVADTVVWPGLDFADSPPDRVTLTWMKPDPADLFFIEQSVGGGPWMPSNSPVRADGDRLFSDFAIADADSQILRLAVNPAAINP